MQHYERDISSINLIISSVLIALISFFYIFSAGTYFEVGVFPLENRSTFEQSFQTFVFDQYIDSLIIFILTLTWITTSLYGKARLVSLLLYGAAAFTALLSNTSSLLDIVTLVSLPVIVIILFYNKFAKTKILNGSTNLTLAIFGIFGFGLGVISLLVSLFETLNLNPTISDYFFQIFILTSVIAPLLIIFLVFGFPIKALLIKSMKKLKINSKTNLSNNKLASKNKILFLSLFMILSVFIVLIPHTPSINPDSELVGSDSIDYADWINGLKSFDSEQILDQVLFAAPYYGDRPVSLFLFIPLVELGDSTELSVDHLPILLAPILVFIVFFLTRELTSNDAVSLFASFLTAVSFHTLIGVYGGLYANWLALIFGYASLIFFIKFLKIPTKKNYILFSIFLFLILFSHVYTWTILTFFMIVYLAVTYKLKFFEKKNIILIAIVLALSIGVDIGKSTFTDSRGGIEADIAQASTRVSTDNLLIIWENLSESIHVFAGGQLSNVLILFLCAYWILRFEHKSLSSIFIGVFFSIAILPILFGNDIIQTRVLYNIPFQIPAAIGLFYFYNRPYGKLISIAICVTIFAMSIKFALNLI